MEVRLPFPVSLPHFPSFSCPRHVSSLFQALCLLGQGDFSLLLPALALSWFSSTPGACTSRWLYYAGITVVEVQSLGKLYCLARSFDKYSSTKRPETSTGQDQRTDRAQEERGKNRETSRTITRSAAVLTCEMQWVETAACMVSEVMLLFGVECMARDLQRGTVSRAETVHPTGTHTLLQPDLFSAKLVQTNTWGKR